LWLCGSFTRLAPSSLSRFVLRDGTVTHLGFFKSEKEAAHAVASASHPLASHTAHNLLAEHDSHLPLE
jgi:hypothetical protein